LKKKYKGVRVTLVRTPFLGSPRVVSRVENKNDEGELWKPVAQLEFARSLG